MECTTKEKKLYDKCIKAIMKTFGNSKEEAMVILEENIKEITDCGESRLEALQEFACNVDDKLLSV